VTAVDPEPVEPGAFVLLGGRVIDFEPEHPRLCVSDRTSSVGRTRD